ncbi:MAG: endonuclease/exonuclease/phosphatase family protein [Bdellovibrionales bacterium]
MKICQWNIENLFLLMDQYEGEDLNTISNKDWQSLSLGNTTPNKHIQKIEDAAKVIRDINADIFLLCEVGGPESLKNFNSYFLNNEYEVIAFEGTSRRSLDVGFLIKKDISNNITSIDNKNLKLSDHSYFSRSLGEIHLKKGGNLKAIFLLTHLKSKLTAEGDFQGLSKRALEIKGLNKHIKSLQKKFNDPKIILAGDLNSDLEDLRLMKLMALDNFLDLKSASTEEKCTHIYFGSSIAYHQFDYIFTTKNLRAFIELGHSYVYRFKNDYGDVLELPKILSEKFQHPSDHYPVVLQLKNDLITE